jgi:hypothetical protein
MISAGSNPGSVARRSLLAAALALPVLARAQDSPDAFEAQLNDLEADDSALEDARGFRELDMRERGPSDDELRARPFLPHTYSSDKAISARARRLIILFEVTNSRRYEERYIHPNWPRGQSGVTIGIGYDLGYSSPEDLASDWNGYLDPSTIDRLAPVCGIKGSDASNLADFLGDVSVPWEAAEPQFGKFLRLVAGETIAAFPNASALGPDSFGALVSLVYNRGSSTRSTRHDPLDRRREMRKIKALLAQGQLSLVPDQILAMRRLWLGVPNARGLLRRRSLEASLFSYGIEA